MSTARVVPSAPVRRVALVRPRFLGDVCLTLPALDAVRAACPEARVAYVVERDGAPLLEGDPRIDELIVVPRPLTPATNLRVIAELRRFAPQVVFDFFCNPRTALWAWTSGARVRVGYPDKGWRSALYTHHARPRTLSAVDFHLASLTAVGWPAPTRTPRLVIADRARAEAREALRELGVADDGPLLGLHPGARWMTRRWMPARFAALGKRFLAAERRGTVLVTGGPDDEALAHEVADELPRERARVVTGWPIARFIALQSLCTAFVCGDTGPLHTAVAAGTPTLGLMSRNRPAMFFPYPESAGHRAYYARAECSPCHRDECDDLRCLTRLTTEGAWERLEDMLARRPSGPAR